MISGKCIPDEKLLKKPGMRVERWPDKFFAIPKAGEAVVARSGEIAKTALVMHGLNESGNPVILINITTF